MLKLELDFWTKWSYYLQMPIGRPLEFDPDLALVSAMQLFWRKGFETSSLQELLNSMGLSKSSFYQTFRSKHALFQRSIQHYRESFCTEMRASLEKAKSGKDFIEDTLSNITDETTGANSRQGCLLMNTASEFAQSDPEIAELVSQSIEIITDIFEMAVRQAQLEGDISPAQDSRTLAMYLVSSIAGLKNMVKAGADRETVKRIAAITLSALR